MIFSSTCHTEIRGFLPNLVRQLTAAEGQFYYIWVACSRVSLSWSQFNINTVLPCFNKPDAYYIFNSNNYRTITDAKKLLQQ